MKVGILTFHRSYNFGANLQALAMQNILRAKGALPVFVNYQEKWKTENYRRSVSSEQMQKHELFFNRYYDESPVFSNEKEVKEFCIEELDAIIVGSDAVFRLNPRYDPINIAKAILRRKQASGSLSSERVSPYWLPWQSKEENRKVIKASVAASSMGTNFYFLSPKLLKDLGNCLADFDFISVRDRWTEKMVKFISRGKIHPLFCPDPAFSLTANFGMPADEKSDIDLSDTILLSGNFRSEWLKKFVAQAYRSGFSVASLPNPDNDFSYPEVDMNIPLPLSPLEWFSLLGKASAYVGMRFHALVSCMVQHTPVINVDNHPRSRIIRSSSKMYDLCQRAGIQDRYYTLKKIHSFSPVQLFDVLFESQSLNRAYSYVDFANKQFSDLIDNVLNLVLD